MAEYGNGKNKSGKGYIYKSGGVYDKNLVSDNDKWDNADNQERGREFTRDYGNTVAAQHVDPNHCSVDGDPDPQNFGGLRTFDRNNQDALILTKAASDGGKPRGDLTVDRKGNYANPKYGNSPWPHRGEEDHTTRRP